MTGWAPQIYTQKEKKKKPNFSLHVAPLPGRCSCERHQDIENDPVQLIAPQIITDANEPKKTRDDDGRYGARYHLQKQIKVLRPWTHGFICHSMDVELRSCFSLTLLAIIHFFNATSEDSKTLQIFKGRFTFIS
jgi:hypothetical protein